MLDLTSRLDLPRNHISRIEDICRLKGETLYGVSHCRHATNGEPFGDTNLFQWTVNEVMGFSDCNIRYCTDTTLKNVALCLNAYNIGAKRKPRHDSDDHKALFRTEDDAQEWRVMLKLKFDLPMPVDYERIMLSNTGRGLYTNLPIDFMIRF